MIALFFSISSGGISRAGVIGKEPATRLRFARSIEALRAEIGKSRPAAGGRLFSVSSKVFLEELYLPLGRSGLFKELFVLLPSEKAMTDTDLADIRDRLARAGLSKTDQASFHLEDGTIRGVMEGISTRLSPLTRIPPREGQEDVLLLDPAFLLMIYRNEVKTPIVELAWKLMVTLREKNVRAEDVVLLDLPPADDLSLRYGFLPALLGDMIAQPSAFAGSPPGKWDILRQAETVSFFAQYPEATMLYRKYLEKNPGDASACYKIAMMAVRDLDDDMALQWLNKAAAADPRFARAFVEAADYLVRKNLLDPAERILRGGVAVFPKDPRMATSLASFFLMRGERIRESGDPEGAAAYFTSAARVEGADPAVREKAIRLTKGEGSDRPEAARPSAGFE
jgi:tetratricopeptide (TPR) repeat protein